LATAVNAAQRGHTVTLFEANDFIGGQFDMARRIPGKEEIAETIRYYTKMLTEYDVSVRLGTRVDAGHPGIDHSTVLTYAEAITRAKPIG
jgi:2,4-dienoyl-CoA reductase (NADPH2)